MVAAAQPTVLVVDDDEAVRTVVSWQLEAAGYAVVQASDGGQALAGLEHHAPDLVVLDLTLPVVAGLDVLRTVREGRTPAAADLPVIVLSGRSGETDRIVGLDQGADDYLVKPFSRASSPPGCDRCCAAPAPTSAARPSPPGGCASTSPAGRCSSTASRRR